MNTLPEEIIDTIYKYKYQMEFQEVVEDLKCIDIREVAKDFNRNGRFVDCCCVWDTIYTVLYIKREAIIFQQLYLL